MSDTASKRRWFRFGLKRMLIALTLLAIVLGWLGSNLQQIRQRKLLVSFIRRGAGFGEPFKTEKLPLLWRVLGQRPMIGNIELPRHFFSENERQQLQGCYPECKVVFVDRAPVMTVSKEEADWAEKHWDD